MITQKRLRAYYKLCLLEKKLREGKQKQRLRLILDHGNGEKVEPGPMQLSVSKRSYKYFTHEKMRKLLGKERFEILLKQIEPTETISVSVQGET